MRARGYIIVRTEFKQEAGKWVGTCPELGTSTYGASLEEVQEALQEMMVLQLNALEETGQRARFFREHKIRLYREKSAPHVRRVELPVDDNVLTQTRLVPVPG